MTVEQFTKGRITIPEDIRKHLGLKENDYVEWKRGNGGSMFYGELYAAIIVKRKS